MKTIKRFLLAGASFLAMTSAAFADPVSIGGFLFTNTFLSASFGLGTLITASQIGLTLALSAGLSLLSGKPNNAGTDPGQYRSTFESSESSEVNAIGRCKLGGLQAFGNTKGVDRYRLILHSATPLVAAEEYSLGERPVTVEPDGLVSSPPYAKAGGSWVKWQVKPDADGTETAWSELVTDFPGVWTTSHKVQGIAQSLVTYTSPGVTTEKFGKLYQSGVPAPAITGRWARVYDPREGGADIDDEDTWVWSTNGVLCAAHIMRQYPDLANSEFDWDDIADEADKADVLVNTKTGTEPRSSCSGVWLSEAKRGDTMTEVLNSIGAEVVLSDSGLIRIRLLDDTPTPELGLIEKYQVSNDWQSGPESPERPNVCRISYYSAERGYEMTEIDLTGISWARVDDEVTRYGEKILDLEFPFCPSASQAQRLGRRMFLGARADVGLLVTNMAGMAAWGVSYGRVSLPDLDENPISNLLPPRCGDESGEVEIPYIVWPEELIDSPWDASTMEAAAPDELPDLSYPSDLDTPAAPSEATVVQYPDTSYELRLKFATVTGGTSPEAIFRGYTGGEPDSYSSMTEYLGSGSTWVAYAALASVGTQVDMKCRWFNAEDEGSYYSDLLTANPSAVDNTTPSAPDTTGTSSLDLDLTVTELRVMRLLVERKVDAGSWETAEDLTDVRPYVTREVTVDGPDELPTYPGTTTIYWRASALTSDGTASSYASGDVTFEGEAP